MGESVAIESLPLEGRNWTLVDLQPKKMASIGNMKNCSWIWRKQDTKILVRHGKFFDKINRVESCLNNLYTVIPFAAHKHFPSQPSFWGNGSKDNVKDLLRLLTSLLRRILNQHNTRRTRSTQSGERQAEEWTGNFRGKKVGGVTFWEKG